MVYLVSYICCKNVGAISVYSYVIDRYKYECYNANT